MSFVSEWLLINFNYTEPTHHLNVMIRIESFDRTFYRSFEQNKISPPFRRTSSRVLTRGACIQILTNKINANFVQSHKTLQYCHWHNKHIGHHILNRQFKWSEVTKAKNIRKLIMKFRSFNKDLSTIVFSVSLPFEI